MSASQKWNRHQHCRNELNVSIAETKFNVSIAEMKCNVKHRCSPINVKHRMNHMHVSVAVIRSTPASPPPAPALHLRIALGHPRQPRGDCELTREPT
eukprot:2981951-Rhodomonas_salina.1